MSTGSSRTLSSPAAGATSERAHVALFVDFANLRQQMRAAGEADGESASGASPASSSPASTSASGDAAEPSIQEVARALVGFAGGVGRVGVARAYADWSREPSLARELNGTRLVPVLVPATDDGEDRSHIRLTVDAMESLLNGDEPDAFVIVSNDPSLVPLVQAIRNDGSEVILVAADEAAADELRTESDSFARFGDVLGGAVGTPVIPRSFADRDASSGVRAGQKRGGSGARGQSESAGGVRRERGQYAGAPLLTEPDFEDYDWDGFIRLIDELEQRLPFVGVRYLVNKVLGPHNCGISDPHIKRDLINEAVDDGLIEMYTVGNVNQRTDPVTACRLDRENPRVSQALGADRTGADGADRDGADRDGADRDGADPESARFEDVGVDSEEGFQEGDEDLAALVRDDPGLLTEVAPGQYSASAP